MSGGAWDRLAAERGADRAVDREIALRLGAPVDDSIWVDSAQSVAGVLRAKVWNRKAKNFRSMALHVEIPSGEVVRFTVFSNAREFSVASSMHLGEELSAEMIDVWGKPGRVRCSSLNGSGDAAPVPEKVTSFCLFCGEEYVPTRPGGQKYCCAECRKMATADDDRRRARRWNYEHKERRREIARDYAARRKARESGEG